MDIGSIWKKRDHCFGSCLAPKCSLKMETITPKQDLLLAQEEDYKLSRIKGPFSKLATSHPPTTETWKQFVDYKSVWSSFPSLLQNIDYCDLEDKYFSSRQRKKCSKRNQTCQRRPEPKTPKSERTKLMNDVMSFVTSDTGVDKVDSGYSEIRVYIPHGDSAAASNKSRKNRARHRKQTKKTRDHQFRLLIEQQQAAQLPEMSSSPGFAVFDFGFSECATESPLISPRNNTQKFSFLVSVSESENDDSDFDDDDQFDLDDTALLEVFPDCNNFQVYIDSIPLQMNEASTAKVPPPAAQDPPPTVCNVTHPVPGDFHAIVNGETEQEKEERLLKIEEANRIWTPLATRTTGYCSKVQFTSSHPVTFTFSEDEDAAYREARVGPWEAFARDRCRFRRRIRLAEDVLGPTLNLPHHARMRDRFRQEFTQANL